MSHNNSSNAWSHDEALYAVASAALNAVVRAVRARANAPMPPGAGYRTHIDLSPDAFRRLSEPVTGQKVSR